MGGGGFALHSIKSLKANRALRKKRKRKSKKDVYGIEGTTQTVHKLKATPAEMKAIREKIEGYKRQERIIWIVAICVTALIIYGLYVWMIG